MALGTEQQADAADCAAQNQEPKLSGELELAREVQLTLYATLASLVDKSARKRSHAKFLQFAIEGLTEVLDQLYGEIPDTLNPRLNRLIDAYTDILERML
jgi:hypothetical protein